MSTEYDSFFKSIKKPLITAHEHFEDRDVRDEQALRLRLRMALSEFMRWTFQYGWVMLDVTEPAQAAERLCRDVRLAVPLVPESEGDFKQCLLDVITQFETHFHSIVKTITVRIFRCGLAWNSARVLMKESIHPIDAEHTVQEAVERAYTKLPGECNMVFRQRGPYGLWWDNEFGRRRWADEMYDLIEDGDVIVVEILRDEDQRAPSGPVQRTPGTAPLISDQQACMKSLLDQLQRTSQ